jgi:hypothetical protein
MIRLLSLLSTLAILSMLDFAHLDFHGGSTLLCSQCGLVGSAEAWIRLCVQRNAI